jgi:hypothetical protein
MAQSSTNFASGTDVDYCKKHFVAANLRWLMKSQGYTVNGAVAEPPQGLRRDFDFPTLTAALSLSVGGVADKLATPFNVVETSLEAGATIDIMQSFMMSNLNDYLKAVHKPDPRGRDDFMLKRPVSEGSEKAKEKIEEPVKAVNQITVTKAEKSHVFNLVGSVVRTTSQTMPGLRFRGYEANRVYLAQVLTCFTKYVNGVVKPNYNPSLITILGMGRHGLSQETCNMAVWGVQCFKEMFPAEDRNKTLQGQAYVSTLYAAMCDVPNQTVKDVMLKMDGLFPNLGSKKLSLMNTTKAYAFPITIPEKVAAEALVKGNVSALQAHVVLKECRSFRGQDRSEQGGLARCAYVGLPVSADIAEIMYYAADIARYELPPNIALMLDSTAATKGKQILTALKMLEYNGDVTVYGNKSCYALPWLSNKGDNKFYSVEGLTMKVHHAMKTVPVGHDIVFDFRDVASNKTKDVERVNEIAEMVEYRIKECNELVEKHKNKHFVVALPACQEAMPFSTGVKLHDLIVYNSTIKLPDNGWWYNVTKDIGKYFYLTVLCNVARTVATFSRKSFLEYLSACKIRTPLLYCNLKGIKKSTFDTSQVIVEDSFLDIDVEGEEGDENGSSSEEDDGGGITFADDEIEGEL